MASKNVRNGAAAAALTVACLCTWEGMDLTAKHQAIDPPGVITACIGQTNYDDPSLKVGQKFTRKECEERLLHDVPKYSKEVDRCVKVDMPPHRRAAITSFTYNVGGATLCRSSVAKELNAGNVQKACDALLRYNRANGKVLRGLDNRRRYERDWCLRND
jgi:lysozyme